MNFAGPTIYNRPDLYFYEGDTKRHFDDGFVKLLSKIKPRFCYPFMFQGVFFSKSGYPSVISALADLDGRFRVYGISRLFAVKDPDSRTKLRNDLAKEYKDFAVKNDQTDMLVDIDGSSNFARRNVSQSKGNVVLRLYHPMSVHVNNEYEPVHLPRWTKGWLAVKEKGQKKVVSLEKIFKDQDGCSAPRVPTN